MGVAGVLLLITESSTISRIRLPVGVRFSKRLSEDTSINGSNIARVKRKAYIGHCLLQKYTPSSILILKTTASTSTRRYTEIVQVLNVVKVNNHSVVKLLNSASRVVGSSPAERKYLC